MPKGKKKGQVLQVVAPEPAGDRWEAELQWDRVEAPRPLPAEAQLALSRGEAAPASENLFAVRYDVAEAEPQLLSSSRRGVGRQRAADVFQAAERELQLAKTEAAAASETLADFHALAEAEKRDAERERAQFATEHEIGLTALGEAESAVGDTMSRAADRFFTEQKNILARIYDLVAHDHEIEDAFNERVARLAECERVRDSYYAEHGAHVAQTAAMRRETAELQEQSLEAMRSALQRTVSDLMVASVLPPSPSTAAGARVGRGGGKEEGGQTPAATDHSATDGRTLLGSELAKSEARIGGRDASVPLRRLVELEEQRLRMACARNAHLQRETAALRAQATHHAHDAAQDSGAALAVTTHNGSAINALTDARRKLDAVTAELRAAQDELSRVSQYHLGQLSGRCGTATLSAPDAVKTAASFLDPETSAAVRATVVEAMVELDTAMRAASGHSLPSTHGGDGEVGAFDQLLATTDLQDRKAVQNFVVRRINRLFTCRHPTAPPTCLDLE